MSIMVELIGQVILEDLLYGTGRGFSMLFLPHLGVEDPNHEESKSKGRWWSLTYVRRGRRFLYGETLQLIGFLIWVVIGALLFVVVKYAV